MPTARERMLELSPLVSGSTARAHFLAIQLGTGNVNVYGEITVELMPDLEVELERDLEVTLEKDLEVTLEKDFEVEMC